MKKIIKVLIVEHSLPFYHIHSWQLLGSHPNIDLTIAYGQGYFTGDKQGVPEGKIPKNPSFRYRKCKITKSFFGKQYLWHSAAISLLKENEFDIIIHQAELKMLSLFYILRYAKKKNTKFALWGIGDPLIPNKKQDKIRKYLAKKSDAFIFYSEKNKQKYLNWKIDPNKLFVAKNSIDINSIFDFSDSFSKDKIIEFKESKNIQSFTILTVGRLIQRKRIDWLIEAISILKNKNHSVKVVVIGNGPEYNNLVNIAKKLGVSDSVIFTGKLSGIEALGPWYLASDIIVAPAQIGHLATEAHAYKKPLVLSDCKTCKGPESEILVPNETGLFYKHGNIENLANQIERLLLSDELREKLSKKSKERVKEFAGTQIMVNGFINAISNLMSCDLKEFH